MKSKIFKEVLKDYKSNSKWFKLKSYIKFKYICISKLGLLKFTKLK